VALKRATGSTPSVALESKMIATVCVIDGCNVNDGSHGFNTVCTYRLGLLLFVVPGKTHMGILALSLLFRELVGGSSFASYRRLL